MPGEAKRYFDLKLVCNDYQKESTYYKHCSSSRSEVLSPSRSPLSISCCRIQLRIDSPVTPRSRAMSLIFRPLSLTKRTASSLNSAGYDGFVFGTGEHLLSKITPSIKVSTKPGQVRDNSL